MSPAADTHPKDPARRRNAGRRGRQHNNRSTEAKPVEHNTESQSNVQVTISSRALKRRRQKQRQREREKQKGRDQAGQTSRPASCPESHSLRCKTHSSYPFAPLSPSGMSACTLASLSQETDIVKREIPPDGLEAMATIEYVEDKPVLEDTAVDEGGADEALDISQGEAAGPLKDWPTYLSSLCYATEFGVSLRAGYERHKRQPYYSYDGSDDRTRYLMQGVQKIQNQQRDLEISKIQEVEEVHQSLKAMLKKSKRRACIRLANTHFRLYSTDYFDHCYNLTYDPSKYVQFYRNDDYGHMFGHVYLNPDRRMDFEAFSDLIFPSPNSVNMPSFDTRHDCNIKFLSNDHLILMLSRNFIFEPNVPPPEAPHYFTFFGVRIDREKERAKREHQAGWGRQSIEDGFSFPNTLCYD